jgi:SET domain-containing protein
MYNLKVTEEFGRGLYANHTIKQNTLLFTAELLVLNPADTVKVNETDLQYYTFKYTDNQDCLVLGDGEIFNHSDTPNTGYKLMDWGNSGRLVMAFFALRDIEADEQLFIDYSADTKVKTQDYTVNLMEVKS